MHKAILVSLLLLTGCGEAPAPAMTVGPASFTEDQLLGLSGARRQLLADLTAFALAVADSTTTELGAPLVQEWVDERLIDVLAAELTLQKNDIGDDVLRARYLMDPAWELTVRHILFFSERWRESAHRDQAAEKAERALASLKEGADFEETASDLSEEPGAKGRAGLLTPGRQGSWVPEFWAAALALEPGGISPVTETQYGYHILRLEDRSIVPFEEGRSAIARAVADRIEDPGAVLDAWLDGRGISDEPSRTTAALAEAARLGLRVPEGEAAELLRKWDDQAYRWGATLGFSYGLSLEQVSVAALAALANPGQNVAITHTELSSHRDLLRTRYTVTMPDPGG